MQPSIFKTMGQLIDDWQESRLDHKKCTDAVAAMAIDMGLEKALAEDPKLAQCYLRGYMTAMKHYRGKIVP